MKVKWADLEIILLYAHEESNSQVLDVNEYISDGETLEIFYTWDLDIPEGFIVTAYRLIWYYEESDESTDPNGPIGCIATWKMLLILYRLNLIIMISQIQMEMILVWICKSN